MEKSQKISSEALAKKAETARVKVALGEEEMVKAKVKIAEGEFDIEKFQQKMDAFMEETFTIWYDEKDVKKAKLSMSANPLDQLDYEKIGKDIDAYKFGEYTMNPETAGLNFQEKEPKVIILDLE